jgi:hypothetical protein
MPTPADTGEIWEVTLEGRQEGQQVLNILHFRIDTPVDNIEERLLRALIMCVIANLIPTGASTYQLIRAFGKQVAPELGPIIEAGPVAGEAVQGGTPGDAAPSFVSVCVNIHSTRGGRSGRGRMFIPGVPEAATSGSYIPTTNPYWVSIVEFLACVAEKFIHVGEPLAANQISLGVMSRKIGGKKPPYDINGFAAATRLAPLNRLSHNVSRRVGRGS